jgi:plasmid stabilization system protein ParE
MALIWLQQAKADIQRLFDFLADVNPTAAAKTIRLIRTGADRLRDHPRPGRPHLGRPIEDGLRRELYLPFASGAYILLYRLEGDTVVIIRVWHGREQRG